MPGTEERAAAAPRRDGGFWQWRDGVAGVEVRFVGRGPAADRRAALDAAGGAGVAVAWAEQIHSDRVLAAGQSGCAGRADALVTDRPALALALVVADCVPLLLAAGERLAAVHAGWRGIAAGIAAHAAAHLAGAARPRAWIGPAIGPCCYEVSEAVAERVAAASGPEVVAPGRRDRPHLDLVRAVELQLAAAGVGDVRRTDACTRCHPDWLWSYRAAGEAAGRNHAFIWRRVSRSAGA